MAQMARERMAEAVAVMLLALCALALLTACGGFPASDYPLAGRLELSAADDVRQLSIGRRESENMVGILVSSTIYAAGCDSTWVIAKRHPSDGGSNINYAVTEYNLVNVADERVHGPFTQAQFTRERRRLGVDPALAFTLYYSENDTPATSPMPAAGNGEHGTTTGAQPRQGGGNNGTE